MKPLYVYIDQGNPLQITRDAEGKPRALLTVDRSANISRIDDLDPDHGYLPSKRGHEVCPGQGNPGGGHWFPVEGTGMNQPEGRARFEVLGLVINQSIPESRVQVCADR